MKALEGPAGREREAVLLSSFKAPPVLRGCTVLCQLPVGNSGSPRKNPLLRRGRRSLKAAGREQGSYAQIAGVKVNLLRGGCRGRPAGGPKRELPSDGSRAGGLSQTPLPLWSERHSAWGANIRAQKESPEALWPEPRWAASYEPCPPQAPTLISGSVISQDPSVLGASIHSLSLVTLS